MTLNVSAWLRELSLERYAQAFADRGVDARTLALLTEADLADIGVKSVGHRRRLVEAIARLDAKPVSTGRAPEVEPLAARAPPVQAMAEHRQLSVLCCDMVGSTALSGRLDAEDLREVIRSFHGACTRLVGEYEGHTANFIGDSVLAYFGWPRAHEDDAERAVRAGRAMVQAVRGLRTPAGEPLAVRVGIATGAVVVGDLIREGPAQEHSAVGAAPVRAEQLQAQASPGEVVVDSLTRRLLGPTFALRPLGSQRLKGSDEPADAYAVLGEQVADSRFDAHKGQQDLAPMIGREQELALLLERWAQARGGEGTAALLVGEAGIGKSRITRALLEACSAQPHHPPHHQVRWQCSPYHSGSALWPVIQRLARSAELGEDDSNEAALDKLEALLGPGDCETTALCATLLGLNGAQRYGVLELSPQMLRERTLELLVEQLFGLAEQRGLLLVVEDAHWIDPTTLELIGRCLERIDGTRMLMLITSRPDNQPALGGHPSVMRLSLSRLSRASVEAIVTRLGGQALQPQTLATIVAQTDGVPLFVEELTKAVLETGESVIPASLHGSLMARLDRIPQVKEVAQIAACIGREFDQALLEAVAEEPETVGTAIDKLTVAELVFRRGGPTRPRFTFKHALVQEATRESLLRGKQQAIHARILDVLERERPETPSGILAHHAACAKQADKAIGHWTRAGNIALAKSAYHEAAGYFTNAIRLVQGQNGGADRRDQELELQTRLGQAYIAAWGFSASATQKVFLRAYELLEADPGGASHSPGVHYGLWGWHISRAEFGQSLQLATKGLAAARTDSTTLVCTHRMVAASHMYLGDFGTARDHYEQAMTLLDSARPLDAAPQFGIDPALVTYSNLAWTLCIQGFADQCNRLLSRARSIGSALPQVSSRAYMHFYCAMPAACLRDHVTVAAEAAALADLASRHRLAVHVGYAHVLGGWAALESGQPAEEAVTAHERGLAAFAAIGSRYCLPLLLAWLAAAMAAAQRQPEALRTIERALTECEQTSQGWCDAELWRVRGELLLREEQPDHAQAVQSFERALSIASARGARLWELRAAVSLARLWADQGERARALARLKPIYDWFTEGFDTVDLVEARTLLGALERLQVGVDTGGRTGSSL